MQSYHIKRKYICLISYVILLSEIFFMEILSKTFFNISKNKQNLYVYFLKFT